jgi:asparagine synthase (glutamine-hydrolysing)
MRQPRSIDVVDGAAAVLPGHVAIEDCSGAAIPLLFEGILFNRHQLSEELALNGEDRSDAELVALAYRVWQGDFVSRLKGQFAVVIWDRSRRTWLAARDAIGLHPLFYALTDRGAVFATCIAGLLAHPAVTRDLNAAALADHLCFQWPDPGETYFAAIRRVPCGSIVQSTAGAVTVRRYWDPVSPERKVLWADAEEAVAQFQRLFTQAVDRRLGMGRPGIFLSGGLDSVSVAAVAAERAPAFGHPMPKALSLAFPHPDCDEREVQTAVARSLRMDLDLLPMEHAVGPAGLLADTLELNATWPSPLLNTWAPAYARLADRGRQAGIEVILTGSGGDEWLGVSPYLAADLIRAGDLRRLASFVKAWRRSYRGSLPMVLGSAVWTFGLRPLASATLGRLQPDAWHRSRKRRLLRSFPAWVAAEGQLRRSLQQRTELALKDMSPPDGFYWREVRTAFSHPLISMEFEELFEFGSRVGVRMQHPYWDADLVEMLYRTHPDVLNAGGRSKGLVRAAVERRFPELGFGRQRKVAATSYSKQLFREQGAALWHRLGDLRQLSALGVVEPRGASAAIERALSDREHPREVSRAWDVLKLEAWARAKVH